MRRSHSCRWQSQTKSKARDEPNTGNSDRYEAADRGMFVDARSKMFRQHLKCSLTEKLHQDVQEQAPDFFCFFLLSQLSDPGSLGTALSGPASRLASAPWPSAAVIPRQLSTAVHFPICRTQSPEELGRVGERSLGWTDCRAATLTFFYFFFMLTGRRRGLGERGDKILCWRHSNCTHYDACRRETTSVFPETLRSASRKTERPFQAQSVSHRTD